LIKEIVFIKDRRLFANKRFPAKLVINNIELKTLQTH